APERFALALYHFNLQFVSGNREAEDRVVSESFLPLVEMYLAHPGWGADFELQGGMVEAMAERHPEALEKFRRLLAAGRAEAVSFHHWDQLLLAFPRHDARVSIRLAREAFERAGLPLSKVVFAQEAQVGEGIHRLAEEEGYEVVLWTGGNFRFFRPDGEIAPWCADGRARIVVGESVRHPRVEVKWTKFGDGEPVATGSTPYALYGIARRPFRFDPRRLAEYEARLAGLEAAGWRIASASEYTRFLGDAGIEPEPFPDVLETARQENTQNVFLWMGKQVHPLEDDHEVLSRAYRARTEVLAAEVAVEWLARTAEVSDERVLVRRAWSKALSAQVSDATGWTPLPIEVRTSLADSDAAMALAREATRIVKERLGCRWLAIDTGSGEARPLDERPAEDEGRPVDSGPAEVTIDGPVLGEEVRWTAHGGGRTDVAIEFLTPAGLLAPVEVSFERARGPFAYAPALVEDRLHEVDLDAQPFDHIWLALPSGLVRLRPGLYLVKHCPVGHIAARAGKADSKVAFALDRPTVKRYRFRFSLYEGEEKGAIELARRINTHPTLVR
ncbi:MAG: hypothetical protein HY720_01290, partial [Planctomycetes bacterium]|nr:hypothetical protein [Planctomycetota bacterium]